MWDTGVKVFFGVGNGSRRGTSFGAKLHPCLTPLAPNYIYSFGALYLLHSLSKEGVGLPSHNLLSQAFEGDSAEAFSE